jgi:hypothetical protein
MKIANRVRSISGIALAMLLVSFAIPTWGEEVRFLKVRFSQAQEELGQAVQNASRLRFDYGQVQENLGRPIRDGASADQTDQEALGRGIAAGALLKGQMGPAQEHLGSSIVRSAQVASAERTILGEIQEHLGKIILAVSRPYPISPEALRMAAQRQAGRLQEDLGGRILSTAQLNWAEEELATLVQTFLRLSHFPETLVKRFEESLSVVRRESGYAPQSALRMGFAQLEMKTGQPFPDLLPEPATVRPNPIGYREAGWGGLWEFGLPSLAGFIAVMGMFTWVLRDLDRRPPDDQMETRLPRAA